MLRIFNVRTDVNACDCTRRLYGHRKRICTESCLWEKNPLPYRGNEPASAVCRSDDLPTELHPRPSQKTRWEVGLCSSRHNVVVVCLFVCFLGGFEFQAIYALTEFLSWAKGKRSGWSKAGVDCKKKTKKRASLSISWPTGGVNLMTRRDLSHSQTSRPWSKTKVRKVNKLAMCHEEKWICLQWKVVSK